MLTVYNSTQRLIHHMKLDTIYIGLIVLIVALLIYAYVSSDQYYKIMLRKAFDKLKDGEEIRKLNPEMNWKLVNMDIDGYINNKKIVMNQPSHELNNNDKNEYMNKNALAAFLNNVMVFDIDSNEPLTLTGATGMDDKPIQHYLPKTTVRAKTPHGHHYYFYNDTGTHIPCYVGLRINNKKYPVDFLTGQQQLIFLPPTRIESERYEWINSPFTHRIEPISKHMHILDLFAHTKEFAISPAPINACISKSIPNLLCIVWDFQIIYQLKYKCTSTTFEKLHSNKHEFLYRTNSTYYLFLKHAPLKNYKAHQFVQHVAELIQKHGITGGIVHLGCGSSHNSNTDVVQFSSCRVHNYKRHELSTDILRANHTLVQTSVLVHYPVHIISSDILHATHHVNDDEDNINNNNGNGNGNAVINEDLFIIFMLSNQTRIPCACLLQISDKNKNKDDLKYTKLIQYFMQNILNVGKPNYSNYSNYSNHSPQTLSFFSEVPMIPNHA